MSAYLRLELRRALRQRGFMIFGLAMPLVLYVTLAGVYGQGADGIDARAWLMVSLATFGAMNGVVAAGGRIALDRATGWSRQLRLTGLRPAAYVGAKALTAFAVAVPSVAVVLATGGAAEGVRLPALRWLLVAASIVLACAPLVVLGIALGTLLRPETLQPIFGGLSFGLAMLGGVWVPLDAMPGWLRTLAEALPSAWITQAGRAVLEGHWVGWHGLTVLVAWTAILCAVAAWAYRRGAERG